MKRVVFLLCAIGSLIFASYAAIRFFGACMAASAFAGMPSQLASLHYYSRLSWLWLGIAVAAVLAFIASVIGVVRQRSIRQAS